VKALSILLCGAAIGIALAIPVVHSSRAPESPLGRLRARLGLAPPPLQVPEPTPEELEAQELARRYGPDRQSQFLEEWIVRDFFHDRRGGVFVDIGSADYKDASNTWFLEQHLGWSGVAVDAQDKYRAGWEQFRPKSKFFTAFVADQSNEKVRLFLSSYSSLVASSQKNFTESWGKLAGSVEVPTITLNDLLAGAHVPSFDFLSLDIELAEPKALAGLDLKRFKPSLVCVEAHPLVRQQILDYFAANHYAVVGKYLRVDRLNLWFMPEGTAVEPFPQQPLSH
jgi:hypothetical protein